jgi:uncharacterized protein
MLRLLDELVWMARREGVAVSTAQAIDALRAVRSVGIEDREALFEALAMVLVTRRDDRAPFERAFAEMFSSEPRPDLFARLRLAGFADAELDILRALLDADEHLGALMEGGSELDRLMQLAGIERELAMVGSPLQAGFFSQRIVDRVGVGAARQRLGSLRTMLVDALGERGEALTRALLAELDGRAEEIRRHVRHRAANNQREPREKPFSALVPSELAETRRAVRSFAARLRGAERARKRRASRGRIDPHRTLRRALATSGVPFAPARRRRRRDRPRLVVLCDVSDSVRSVATFLLEFTYAAQELFSDTRSFVFVSELREVTDLFATEGVLALAHGSTDNSNYGRVLRSFEEQHLRSIDRRTTVVILGDGRTNYHADASDVLARIRERARALLWLCPEPRSAWSSGDSAMSRYARECSAVLEVRSARDLEAAAREILVRR